MDDGHAAQPGGRDEPREVRHGAPADRHDGVGPREPAPAELVHSRAATSAVFADSVSGTVASCTMRPATRRRSTTGWAAAQGTRAGRRGPGGRSAPAGPPGR